MSKERNAFVDKMLGLDGAMEILEGEGIQALVAKLSAGGVSHKSEDKPATTPLTQEETVKAIATIGNMVGALIESQGDLSDELTAAKAELNARAKAYDDGAKALQDAIKATQDMQAALKEQLDARPRMASRDPGNTVENDKLKQELASSGTKIDPVFGVRVKE